MNKTKSGIYVITSPSGKKYVGSAVAFNVRWNLHLTHLRQGRHHNKGLQNAWNKYGAGCLVFQPIFCCQKEELLVWEQHFIEELNPEYNIAKNAVGRLGVINSPEHNARIGASHIGKKYSPERCAQISASKTGKKLSPESLEKRRQALSGEKLDALREACRKGQLGKKQSEETKRKRAEAQRGKKMSDEARENMRKAAFAREAVKRAARSNMDLSHAFNFGESEQSVSAC